MKTTNLRIAVAALAILAGIGVAQAQGRHDGPQMPMTFESLDVDGSGEIDSADLDALRLQRFAEIDTDGNGSISEDEFVAHAAARAGERAAEMFARLDADGDGVLSRDVLESRAGPEMGARMIERADTDGSGGVSEAEFEAMKTRMAEFRGRGERDGDGPRFGGGFGRQRH